MMNILVTVTVTCLFTFFSLNEVFSVGSFFFFFLIAGVHLVSVRKSTAMEHTGC